MRAAVLPRFFFILAILTGLGRTVSAEPERVFQIGGKAPSRVVFALDAANPDALVSDTPMGRVMAGVLAVEKGNAAVGRVSRLIERRTRPRSSSTIESLIAIAWLYDEESVGEAPAPKRVAIGRTSDDWLLAQELDDEGNGVDLARLNDKRFAMLSEDWPRYRRLYREAATDPVGRMVELSKPYVASRIILDSDELRRRIYGRAPTDVPPLDRDLDTERMFIRLPVGYDPGKPTGLLVWIHAVNSGQQPLGVFAPALDKFGLICVSVENAGNSREIVDRLQLMLDAVETVGARYLLDNDRIYATGISGGGRSSSMLWACFPDVFTGAVPIVGLNSYDLAPTGTGRAWPKNFMKPRGRAWALLKTHRLAAITGRNDFNEPEMQVRIRAMARDGLDVQLVDQPEMAHEMPTPETFTAALGWVEESANERQTERAESARQLLERAQSLSAAARDKLYFRVIESAPWSEAAFDALTEVGSIRIEEPSEQDSSQPDD